MLIGVTGATGFLGRYLVHRLAAAGHRCRCWFRPQSDRTGWPFNECQVEWVAGELDQPDACQRLVEGCDAVVHSGLHRQGTGFRGAEGELCEFVQKNVVGTIQLIEAARRAGVPRFVFISSCAVHEKILDDRPLDEAHPLWPTSHYGAYKAAVEKFVHSYGLGEGYAICSLRPTGIYGVAHPIERSRWFHLVRAVVAGETVWCQRGGKEVHAADVAKAVDLLLTAEAERIRGEAFNCYDRYVSEYEVATLAKELSGSAARIEGAPTWPKHQIETGKIRSLGMEFGGEPLLRETVAQLVEAARRRLST